MTRRTTLIQVPNWTEASNVEIEHSMPHGEPGPYRVPALVNMHCDGGSLRFSHSMNPSQARAMAAALVVGAEAVEALGEAAK